MGSDPRRLAPDAGELPLPRPRVRALAGERGRDAPLPDPPRPPGADRGTAPLVRDPVVRLRADLRGRRLRLPQATPSPPDPLPLTGEGEKSVPPLHVCGEGVRG